MINLPKTKINKTDTRIVKNKDRSSFKKVKADICVIGAGISGISAALKAAELGHEVVLIDGLPALGGQAVNSIIGIFCGLFSNGPEPYQFTHEIIDDILSDLGKEGALHYRHGIPRTVIYDVTALSRWIEEKVRKANISVILGAVLQKALKKNKRISSVELATRYGNIKVTANSFVEASGDAALAWYAGLPCREPLQDTTIYGTEMFVLEGINMKYGPEEEEISKCLKKKAESYGLVRKEGFAMYFPPAETLLVNMTHMKTPLEPLSASREALEGKSQADKVADFLRKEFPRAFANAKVRNYGLPGIRQTRWIVGCKQLTVADIRNGTEFPDAIARTTWPLELHDYIEGYIWEPFPEEHVHYVPFASMISPEINNLVAAGRCIDGDLVALSSVRVMGPCIAMGVAAANALDLAGKGSVHDIDISLLQERLKDNLERTDRGCFNY